MSNPIRNALSTARTWVRATGLTQQEIADRAGISLRSITYFNRAEHDPKVSTLARIFDVMAEVALGDDSAGSQKIAQASREANSSGEAQPQHNEATP